MTSYQMSSYPKPKKHLGQHFLTDLNIAEKIVGCLDEGFESVCELGPGTGVLTKYILRRGKLKLLTLVEVDRESVEYLEANFDDDRLSVLNADFLKIDLQSQLRTPFALIGNFPYNISSQIFFKVIENRDMIPQVVCMIQKEVAERIAAPPGSKTYGILSVLLQTWYDIRYNFTVNENVFFPPPRVKSAVITLKRNSTERLGCDEALFVKVVKIAFNQRRKTLRNALKSMLPEDIKSDSLFDQRAERLSVKQFVEMTNMIGPSQ